MHRKASSLCSHLCARPVPASLPRSYATVAVSGYTLFGSAIDGDVLKDLTARFVATLVPRSVAHGIVYGVALSCEPPALAAPGPVRSADPGRPRGGGQGWRRRAQTPGTRRELGHSSVRMLLATARPHPGPHRRPSSLQTRCACWPTLCSRCAVPGLRWGTQCVHAAAHSVAGLWRIPADHGQPKVKQRPQTPTPCDCLVASPAARHPQVFAVREALVEMTLSVPSCSLAALPFYSITAALVALAYLISVLVPSIYVGGGMHPAQTGCAKCWALCTDGLLVVPAARATSAAARACGNSRVPCISPALHGFAGVRRHPRFSPLHTLQGLLALVGATATVVFSYVFPSLVVLKCKPSSLQRAGESRACGHMSGAAF